MLCLYLKDQWLDWYIYTYMYMYERKRARERERERRGKYTINYSTFRAALFFEIISNRRRVSMIATDKVNNNEKDRTVYWAATGVPRRIHVVIVDPCVPLSQWTRHNGWKRLDWLTCQTVCYITVPVVWYRAMLDAGCCLWAVLPLALWVVLSC